MKPVLLLALLMLSFTVQGQLTFEEVTPPDDFSIRLLRKSPAGEYFMQLANDYKGIYTSTDGHDWTRHLIASSFFVQEIWFFSDGTPLLQCSDDDDYVRRNGAWVPLDQGTGWNDIHISSIREDTLFIFNNKRFAFSTDKGQSYTVLGTYSGLVDTQYAVLNVFEHHFALYRSPLSEDTLSIFNRQGLRVAAFPIELKYPNHIVYNDCNELLLINDDDYYLFKEAGLQITSGHADEVLPDSFEYRNIQAAQGQYYLKDGNQVFTAPCGTFNWQPVFQDPLLDSLNRCWLSREGDLLLFKHFGNAFYDQSGWTTTRTLYSPPINFPCLLGVNESAHDRQVTRTSNGIFTKLLHEQDWHLIPTLADLHTMTYSPDGDLYISMSNEILYSKDNGATFSSIQLPFGQLYPYLTYRLIVADRNVLFLHRAFNSTYVSYYSINNGQDWKEVWLPMTPDPPVIKRLGNQIQIAYLSEDFYVLRVHLGTGEITTHPIGQYINTYRGAVTDDGTIYYRASENFFQVDLYRYHFGEIPENLGHFPDLPSMLIASGNNVYAVSDSLYYLINDGQIKEYPIMGIQADGYPSYSLSENDHLYIEYDQNRIFRSNEVLSFPKFISGSLYHNTQEDCVTDTLDPGLGSWVVKVENDQFLRTTVTNEDGDFTTDVPTGEYTVSIKPISEYWEVCDSAFVVIIDSSSPVVGPEFLATALQHCAKLEIDFSTPLLRRCFPNTYYITVRNTGPEPSEGTGVRFTLDPYFIFISSSIPHTQISAQVFEFDLGILAVNDAITFSVTVSVSCNAELGMEHCTEGSVFDDLLCDDERTAYKECQVNVGAIDPNDKRVFNEAGREVERVDKGEYIYYHIRFQNTGTDTAFTVRINDPLSPMLDYETLEMLSASHPYSWLLTDGPALSILFENILLPDSNINEPASHGYVKFRIKPLPEFDYGTSIPNTAEIYFDFNDPVLTNTVTTLILPTVKTVESADLIEFSLFPNPTDTDIQLSLADDDRRRIDSYEVIDVLGQQVLQFNTIDNSTIPVSRLTPGMYNLVLKEHGVVIGMKKFVKM